MQSIELGELVGDGELAAVLVDVDFSLKEVGVRFSLLSGGDFLDGSDGGFAFPDLGGINLRFRFGFLENLVENTVFGRTLENAVVDGAVEGLLRGRVLAVDLILTALADGLRAEKLHHITKFEVVLRREVLPALLRRVVLSALLRLVELYLGDLIFAESCEDVGFPDFDFGARDFRAQTIHSGDERLIVEVSLGVQLLRLVQL